MAMDPRFLAAYVAEQEQWPSRARHTLKCDDACVMAGRSAMGIRPPAEPRGLPSERPPESPFWGPAKADW